MAHLLVNLFCAGYAIAFCVSFLFFDRLLRMESQVPEDQRHQGGRATGIFSVAREMSGSYPQWRDLKAVLVGLRLYVLWLFRTPQWVRSDPRARRALWAMRSLFWLCIIGAYIVKDTLL
jgi:hypothetical protein